jgi:hypothetical protein
LRYLLSIASDVSFIASPSDIRNQHPLFQKPPVLLYT